MFILIIIVPMVSSITVLYFVLYSLVERAVTGPYNLVVLCYQLFQGFLCYFATS